MLISIIAGLWRAALPLDSAEGRLHQSRNEQKELPAGVPARLDMCLRNPGYEVDLTICSNIRRFIEAWRGIRDLRKEIVNGHIKVEGKKEYRRALPDWLLGSALGSFERSHSGPERDLFSASHSVTAK